MEKLLNNKRILIIGALTVLLVIVIVVGLIMGRGHSGGVNPDTEVTTPIEDESEDNYMRDENGAIKNVLIIDNEEYKLTMDLLGTWKEYLLPTDERDKYQAFMIPDKVSDTIPYFYILIEPSEVVTNEAVIEQEIIYNIKNQFDSFELESVSKKNTDTFTKYSVTYKTTKSREESKNYVTIVYKDGYKISFTYSALSIAYAAEKGYIDDMISTFDFEIK